MKTKTLRIALTVLTVLFAFTAFNAGAQTMARNDVKDLVIKSVRYPQDAIDKHLEGDVLVSFKPNAQGKVEVEEIFSRIPELSESVLSTISDIVLPQPAEQLTDPIVLRFTFKLI